MDEDGRPLSTLSSGGGREREQVLSRTDEEEAGWQLWPVQAHLVLGLEGALSPVHLSLHRCLCSCPGSQPAEAAGHTLRSALGAEAQLLLVGVR